MLPSPRSQPQQAGRPRRVARRRAGVRARRTGRRGPRRSRRRSSARRSWRRRAGTARSARPAHGRGRPRAVRSARPVERDRRSGLRLGGAGVESRHDEFPRIRRTSCVEWLFGGRRSNGGCPRSESATVLITGASSIPPHRPEADDGIRTRMRSPPPVPEVSAACAPGTLPPEIKVAAPPRRSEPAHREVREVWVSRDRSRRNRRRCSNP